MRTPSAYQMTWTDEFDANGATVAEMQEHLDARTANQPLKATVAAHPNNPELLRVTWTGEAHALLDLLDDWAVESPAVTLEWVGYSKFINQ